MKSRQATILAIAVIAASVLLPIPQRGRIAGLPSFCMTQMLFGIPCLFCGMTRSFVCMGHGRVEEAFSYHLLGPMAFILIAIVAVFDIFQWKWRPSQQLSQRFIAIGAATFCVVWITRLFGLWPMPSG